MVVFHNSRSPGNMYVARKPHPVGNEYHTICDAGTGILFKMELVEGKSRPPELGKPAFEEAHNSKTTGLVLRMTDELAGSGRVVVMDSAFCVMKAVVAMQQRGIYVTTVAKKRSYWPRDIPGDDILAYMHQKPVGEVHGRRGRLGNTTFNLFAVNHTRYTFILVATYGSTLLESTPKTIRTADGQTFSFKRNEPISDYYRARHAVDDHNHYRQGQRVSFEKAWGSKFWENRQFSFVVAATLVNAMLAYNHFVAARHAKPRHTFDEFKRLVATELASSWREQQVAAVAEPKRARRSTEREHQLIKIPKFEGSRLGSVTKKAYQQVRCKWQGCDKFTRQYCSCDRNLVLCQGCMVMHLAEVFSDG